MTNPRMHLHVCHQQSWLLSILTHFMDYYSILGSRSDFHGCQTPGCQHSQFWLILARFLDYYSPFWGPKAISMVVEAQGALTCQSSTLAVFLDSNPFHGLLHNFGVSKRFPWLSNPGVRLHVGHQHSQIWPILVRLLDYYSPFSSPEVISMLNEPRGAFTCR